MMPIPIIILSLFMGVPKEDALVVVFNNGTKEEVQAFVTILRRKVKEHDIRDARTLESMAVTLANAVDADIRCYPGNTIFMNEVL
jgi:hypothetical protein